MRISDLDSGKAVVSLLAAWVVAWAGLSAGSVSRPVAVQKVTPSTKTSLTQSQRKIDSQLRIEIDGLRTNGRVPKTTVRVDRRKRAYVDVRAEVTPALESQLKALGSTIVSSSVEFRSVIAWVPLEELDAIAALSAVHAIVPTPAPSIRK